jgi:hypothetical protein
MFSSENDVLVYGLLDVPKLLPLHFVLQYLIAFLVSFRYSKCYIILPRPHLYDIHVSNFDH